MYAWMPCLLFGIAMPILHDLNFQKCTFVTITWYRLSSKVEGLFVSYIVDIFDTIK